MSPVPKPQSHANGEAGECEDRLVSSLYLLYLSHPACRVSCHVSTQGLDPNLCLKSRLEMIPKHSYSI